MQLLEIDSNEVPIMDGSAKLFVDKINNIGLNLVINQLR